MAENFSPKDLIVDCPTKFHFPLRIRPRELGANGGYARALYRMARRKWDGQKEEGEDKATHHFTDLTTP